jgi:hypothetical protein
VGNPVTTRYPGLLLASGTEAGLNWEVAANGLGYRCGYVMVPAGHPWWRLDYDDIDNPYPHVHGGLTFAGQDTSLYGTWFGFDCAHYGDAPDPSLPGYLALMDFGDSVIRSTQYVASECRSLARQAAAAQPSARLRVRALARHELGEGWP